MMIRRTAAALALVLTLAACEHGRTATPGPATAPPPAAVEPPPVTEVEPPPPNPASPVRAELAALAVRETGTIVANYDRSLFEHWTDPDGNGCDTRQDVLAEEALGEVQRDPYGGRCPQIVEGDWLSIYDDMIVTDPSELDVDHLVALAEAWYSGAHAWTPEQREAFANDRSNPDTLVAVTASTNRSKGARAPDQWLPPDPTTHCWYAQAWIGVKFDWNMTVRQAEADALRRILTDCGL